MKCNESVRSQVPLVHCITNYVTVNDVANALLACGGSPIMADDIGEVADSTSISNALVLGGLSSAQQQIVNGLIIIAAVALSNLGQRKNRSK